MDNVIEIENLVKSYGDLRAVEGISFCVERGSLFAFLGVNGAGKSTTINILCSILAKDSGKITVDGLDLDKQSQEIKRLTGIVFQSTVLDDRLSVRDNLTIRASYYGLRGREWKNRLATLSELIDLDEILDRPFGKLSGGQRRRADIARGLIHSPKILFLDEPTTGLDPMTRQSVWKLINKLRSEEGMTVFLTTHYMEEADKADNVVIIDKGRIVAEGSPAELKEKYTGDYVKLYRPESEETNAKLAAENVEYSYRGDAYLIKTASSKEALGFIKNHLDDMGEFEVIKGDMDDVFLNATKRNREGEEL